MWTSEEFLDEYSTVSQESMLSRVTERENTDLCRSTIDKDLLSFLPWC